MKKGRIEELRADSGTVTYTDPLTSFFYQLLRDHLPAGEVEKIVSDIVNEAGQDIVFTNGWLAKYANNLADTLRNAETSKLKGSLNKIWEETEEVVVDRPKVKEAITEEIVDSDLAGVKALIDSSDEDEGPDENVMADLEEGKAALQSMISNGQLSSEDAEQIKAEISDLLNNKMQPIVEVHSDEEEESQEEETDGRSTEPQEQEVAGQ